MERVDHPKHVRLEHLRERTHVFGVLGQRTARDTGVRDHDVGNTEATDEVRTGRGEHGSVTYVTRVDGNLGGSERLLESRELGCATREQSDAGTVRRVVACERLADPRRRAGDEDAGRSGSGQPLARSARALAIS